MNILYISGEYLSGIEMVFIVLQTLISLMVLENYDCYLLFKWGHLQSFQVKFMNNFAHLPYL